MKKLIKKVIKRLLLKPFIRKNLLKILGIYKNYFSAVLQEISEPLQEIYEKMFILTKVDKEKNYLFPCKPLLYNELLLCEFPEKDAKALEEIVKMVLKKHIKIIEIGSWTGTSTGIMAKLIKPYKGKIFAVDHWLGSVNVPHHKIAAKIDIFTIFKFNMVKENVWEIVFPLVMKSQEAAEIFRENTVDLIFIDGDHSYECVKQDILLWWPKLKVGGIMCGHDCEVFYTHLSDEEKELVNQQLDKDCIPIEKITKKEKITVHPGVIKALYDIFGENYKIFPNSTIWYCIKETDIILKSQNVFLR